MKGHERKDYWQKTVVEYVVYINKTKRKESRQEIPLRYTKLTNFHLKP